MTIDESARVFDEQRPRLLNVAYRLTGSWADAEDVVSDVWPRWQAHAATVEVPAAWLTRVTSRAALDLLRSARVRRESYVGPWLPEPVVQDLSGRPLAGAGPDDPAEKVVLDESVRMALLVVLDSLTPEQRVAVVLHDVFDLTFTEVAAVLGISVQTARQHVSRGRRRLKDADVPPALPVGAQLAVLAQLSEALVSGETARVTALLAPDAVLVSDGAGEVSAARRPLVGAEEIARFMLGLARRLGDEDITFEPVLVNGVPGALMRNRSGKRREPTVGVYSYSVRDGRVVAVHAVLAPAKVGRYA